MNFINSRRQLSPHRSKTRHERFGLLFLGRGPFGAASRQTLSRRRLNFENGRLARAALSLRQRPTRRGLDLQRRRASCHVVRAGARPSCDPRAGSQIHAVRARARAVGDVEIIVVRHGVLVSRDVSIKKVVSPMFAEFTLNSTHVTRDVHTNYFNDKHVAVLLVGQPFRGPNHTTCNLDASSIMDQEEVATALKTFVCKPLEDVGAHVRILLTYSRCASMRATKIVSKLLSHWYFPRLVKTRMVDSANMGHGWSLAWSMLVRSVRKPFDYILQTRHDVQIMNPIVDWPSNFSRFLFEQQCWKCCDAFVSKGFSCDSGCCCGRAHPFVQYHVNRSNRNVFVHSAMCPPRMCVADRLLWVPGKYTSFVMNVHRRLHDPWYAVHNFHRPVLHAAGQMQWSENQFGFLFPSESTDAEYVDLHRRRRRLQDHVERRRMLRSSTV